MTPSGHNSDAIHSSILTEDQQDACARLLALARVRATTTEAALPTNVLGRWNVPLLIGPAGSGKSFVCEEVARRLGPHVPCRRWDVGSWIITANRSSDTTLEQIQAFIETHPVGCVVHLAGVDALAARLERNVGYYQAMASEVARFLDRASMRPVRFAKRDGGEEPRANVLVVAAGCFPSLWGEVAIGDLQGADMWKLADQEPLAGPAAVAKWLLEHSYLPAAILRRFAPEPMILRPVDAEQAARLAVRLRDNLPPMLDGLGVGEFGAALQSPSGWRAVAALIERAWVDGYADPSRPDVDHWVPKPQETLPEPPKAKASKVQQPVRLGEKLGLPSNRSRLIAKARRLGLCRVADFERLAMARGYFLPSEDTTAHVTAKEIARNEFTDSELAAALLSPCLEYSESAICRGTQMLGALLVALNPASFVYEVRRGRGEAVLRHVARIGRELDPHCRLWREFLLMLPSTLMMSNLPSDIMPDAAIRHIFRAARP